GVAWVSALGSLGAAQSQYPREAGAAQPDPRGTNCHGIDRIFFLWHTGLVAWEVEFTDEFGDWWATLREEQQDDVAHSVGLLAELGPALGFPHSSEVRTSRHAHMRELRTQGGGRPLRTLYAFTPVRTAILLLGGGKTGDDRWYERAVPLADRLYDEHLRELRKEGRL